MYEIQKEREKQKLIKTILEMKSFPTLTENIFIISYWMRNNKLMKSSSTTLSEEKKA